ncbi:MAG: hypothetical protein HQL33_06020 [Alphaproteobacteria bacterium]|nr:hypothetical protein [Alphaproteobacteria bacterium]
MKGESDLDLAEAVSTWVSHALAGTIGAVVNGLELLKEDGASPARETVDLVDGSAVAAARRLKFFRAVFGVADKGDGDAPAARALLRDYLAASRGGVASVEVEWPEAWSGAARVDPRVLQLVLAMALFGSECLLRAGTLAVREDPTGLTVTAIGGADGRGVRLDEGSAAALGKTAPPPSPRAVPAFFAARLARRLGADIRAAQTDGRIVLTAAPLTPT